MVSGRAFVLAALAVWLPGAVFGQAGPAAEQTAAPTPRGNPADWFPSTAYPAAAKAAGAEGRTAFAMAIDSQGRVTGCNIVETSGSPLLDSTTCMLAVTNGRFVPAHDAAGRPVAGTWKSAMRWKLESAGYGDAE